MPMVIDSVPLLDLTRDKSLLADVSAALDRVVGSGRYVLGPEGGALEQELAKYLGIESVRGDDGTGITVSYWADEDAVAAWRAHPEHLETQARGRADWYEWYELRVARVERARGWHR